MSGADGPCVVVAVPVDGPAADLVADELFGLGASAVSELDDGDGTVLVADLPARAAGLLVRPHRVLEPERDWTDGWQAHAGVVRVGRLVVRPSWVEGPTRGRPPGDDGVEPGGVVTREGAAGEVEVVLDAADAFGSGSHPTTRLCLAQVERLVRPGARVLDVGSGTGVLGVAALLLGAGHLTAIDIDPAAVRATAGTARLNGVADRTQASATPLAQVRDRFDLVLANLLIPAVEQLGAGMARVVAPGGHLVLSGVLVGQVDRAAAAVGAAPASVSRDDAWAALVFAPP